MATGHVRPRGKNKYQLEVDLGTSYTNPETGKRKRNKKYKTITARGIREAELALSKFLVEVTGKDYHEPSKMKFVDFVYNEWLPKHARKHLSHTTLQKHMDYLEKRILPAFQYLRMDQVKPMHLIDFLHNLEEDGMRLDGKAGKLSSSTIFYNYRILNNLFNFAVTCRIVSKSPVKEIDKPKVEYKESEVYTLEEASDLLDCLESELLHWNIIVKLAITTGMRRSELFGLEFKHFDLDKRILHVRQALTHSRSGGYQVHEIKKGNRSAKKRDIILSESLIAPIKKLHLLRKRERVAAKELWGEGKYDFLLCDENGKPYNPDSMKNWWSRFIKRHELKYINIHALRHTSATLLINEGVHAKIIAERLGHSNITTTMNVYGHALKQADTVATDKLDAAFSKRKLNQ
ncbi:site-specific integrase [Domibacillus tundrae]|uniref:site-specific integrase n=1 Tax=Domibacillus tundrae TaxID=1587527 RepID=UPI00061825B6|nr:site-specific integrase [Domibacillus tundrae]